MLPVAVDGKRPQEIKVKPAASCRSVILMIGDFLFHTSDSLLFVCLDFLLRPELEVLSGGLRCPVRLFVSTGSRWREGAGVCRKSLVDVMILLMCYLLLVAVLLCN